MFSTLPLFLTALVMASGASAAVLTRSMEPFGTVKICTPFNVLLQPSSGNGQYQVLLDADKDVQSTLQASVTNGVLSLGASDHFTSSQPIKLTVRCTSFMPVHNTTLPNEISFFSQL